MGKRSGKTSHDSIIPRSMLICKSWSWNWNLPYITIWTLKQKWFFGFLGQGLSLQTHMGTTMMLFSFTEYRKLNKLNANSNLILNFARKWKWRVQGSKGLLFKTGVQMLLHSFTGNFITEKGLVYTSQFIYTWIFKTTKPAYSCDCTVYIKNSI